MFLYVSLEVILANPMAKLGNDSSDVSWYNLEDIVETWLKGYAVEKEREFVRCIDKCIPKSHVTLLDIGCGPGLHTWLWSQRNKQVTAADFSKQFRDYILRTYRFPFIWADVLNCEIQEKYDVCFCMAISTILLDEERRFRTFETLARLGREGSFLVIVFPSNQRPFVGAHPRHGSIQSLKRILKNCAPWALRWNECFAGVAPPRRYGVSPF